MDIYSNRQLHQWTIHQWTTTSTDNYSNGQLHQQITIPTNNYSNRQLYQRTTTSIDNYSNGQLQQWATTPMNNYPTDNDINGQLNQWTITPTDKYTNRQLNHLTGLFTLIHQWTITRYEKTNVNNCYNIGCTPPPQAVWVKSSPRFSSSYLTPKSVQVYFLTTFIFNTFLQVHSSSWLSYYMNEKDSFKLLLASTSLNFSYFITDSEGQ